LERSGAGSGPGAARRVCARLALLAGPALVTLVAASAEAQTASELPVRAPGMAAPVNPLDLPKAKPAAPPAPTVPDGLGERGFYLEADTLIRDDKANTWTAQGGVEARYQGRVLRGDEVIYNVATGGVTATGHVALLNPDGTAEFADHLVLDDKMRAGFARGFSARLPDKIKLAADIAVRQSETVTDLNRAAYTPCEVCAADGSPKAPTWSIRASKIVEDKQRKLILYRNAIIEVKGLPVFYVPVFWHPDPEAGRTSGLMIPTVAVSNKRGFTYQQTYYQVLSPSEELYITPQINARVNPLLNLEWRARFYSGFIDARGGYTYEQNFNEDGDKFGQATSRSYIIANGQFNLTPDWTWGFSTIRASDPFIFAKYDIANLYENGGLIANSSQQLMSQIYATRQDHDSYFQIAALSFQGVTSAVDPTFTLQPGGSLPWIAPVVEFRYDPEQSILGGRLRLLGSGVIMGRTELPPAPIISTDIPGESLDSRRATAQADWRSSYTFANGMRLEPFVDVREDVFDSSPPNSTLHTTQAIALTNATAGVDFSWPFYRQVGGANVVLEPLAQLDLSPTQKLNPNIPDEDSRLFIFDETNLFDPDKFTGYDLFDSGQRLNVGGRATIDWGDGKTVQVLLGRTLRAETTNIYSPNTGLNKTASDWVLAADTTPVDGLSVFSRALIDDNGSFQRLELGTNFAYAIAHGYVRYLMDNTQLDGREEDLEAGGETFVSRHWGFSATVVRDLRLNAWRERELGVIYRDDCIRVQVVYQHKDTIQGFIDRSDTVFLRLTLATLGGEGYKNDDFR
jgi:LPS-assembly protein